MQLIKLLKQDIKKNLYGISDIILMLLIQIFILFILAYTITPNLFTKGMENKMNIAVVDMDNSLETRYILNHFENLDFADKLLSINKVEYETAINMLKNDEALLAIVIPENISRNLYYQNPMSIDIISGNNKIVKILIVKELLDRKTELVNQANSAINTLWYFLDETGMDYDDVNEEFKNMAIDYYLRILSKNTMFKSPIEYTALDNINPIIYYVASILSIFVFLGAISIIKPIYYDINNGILRRISLKKHAVFQYFISKLLTFSFMQIIIYTIIISIISVVLKEFIQLNILYLLTSIVSISLLGCIFSILVILLSKNFIASQVTMFFSTIILGLIGGSFIPIAYFPRSLRFITYFSPFVWARNAILGAVFGQATRINLSLLVMLIFFTLFTFIFLVILKKEKVYGFNSYN